MQIIPELLSAYRTSLQEQRISIHFVAGSWQSLRLNSEFYGSPFDITLTSETIYQTSSLPSLIGLLKTTSQPIREGSSDEDITAMSKHLSLEERKRLCLVAAKVLYFGVGGGVMEFQRAVEEAGGKVTTVQERTAGVGRKIMQVEWSGR